MYELVYTNPNNVIRREPYVVKSNSKVEIREILNRARQYPGSYEIVSLTKTTKSRGVEHISTIGF